MRFGRVASATLWILFVLAAALTHNAQPVRSEGSEPLIAMINPGPSSYSRIRWTASSNVRNLGTSSFIFCSNETSVGDVFFVNITVINASCVTGCGMGVFWDTSHLKFLGCWTPSDFVLSYPWDHGWLFVLLSPESGPYNDTHDYMFDGYYLQEPGWSFNGTGTAWQMSFRIIHSVNETDQPLSSWISFDPGMTGVVVNRDTVVYTPVQNGRFVYEWGPPRAGDLNHDTWVKMDDLMIVMGAFGSTPGHPRWNQTADTNSDDKIDLTDVVVILVNYGQH